MGSPCALAPAGDFVRDKKEGMGVLLMMQRHKKYVAEYVNGKPVCGSMLCIDNVDLEPLQGRLLALALRRQLENMASGEAEIYMESRKTAGKFFSDG